MTALTSRVGGRVSVLKAVGELVIDEREVPTPAPGGALVRIVASGVCGTDLHAYRGRSDRLPMTLGHDAVGVVEAVGADDVHELLGRRVTIDPMLTCGQCAYCVGGLSQLCVNGGYLGMTLPGTLADYIALPARNLVPLPDDVSDVAATVLEPITVALHLLDRIGAFRPDGMRAHVVGGGPLGVLLAQTLAARGWTPTVYEPQEHRRALCSAAGIDVREPVAEPASGPSLVVETSASGPGVELARSIVGPGSVVALVGRAPADFSSAEILLKELTVLGVRAGVGQYPEAIVLVAQGLVTPTAVVTDHYSLADVAAAFADVTRPDNLIMRAIVHAQLA